MKSPRNPALIEPKSALTARSSSLRRLGIHVEFCVALSVTNFLAEVSASDGAKSKMTPSLDAAPMTGGKESRKTERSGGSRMVEGSMR